MQKSISRLVAAILVAAIGVTLGLKLAVYSEADDAPGGVLIAIFIMMGSVVLGLWIALRRARASSNGG